MCHYSGVRWHPKTVILYSITVESGQERSYWIFFFLKIVHGRYFNISHQTTVVYLYYNCHQDPYLPSIQRGADVFSSFHSPFFLWGCHLHCKRRLSCVCWDLTWRLEGRETAQSKVVIGVVTRGPSDTDSWLTKPVESTEWNSCLGKWKAVLWKERFFFSPNTNKLMRNHWQRHNDILLPWYRLRSCRVGDALRRRYFCPFFFFKSRLVSGECKSCWFSFSDLIEQIQKRFIDKQSLHLLQRHLPLIYKLFRESFCVVTTTCHHPITEQAGSFSRVIQYVIKLLYMSFFFKCKCYLTWSVVIP